MALQGRQGRSFSVAVALALAVAVGLAACGRERSGSRATRRPADAAASTDAGAQLVAAPALHLPGSPAGGGPTPRPGGVLRVHLESEPPHLNPLVESPQVVQRVLSGLVYETLIECRADRYLPALAESWEESTDRLRVILRLRAGVRWHDDCHSFPGHPIHTCARQCFRDGPGTRFRRG